jgi:hypothetical protein
MSVQYKIQITKQILSDCMHCGNNADGPKIEENCPIAIALNHIFPNVYVTEHYIFPFGIDMDHIKIQLPSIAHQFIRLFDGFRMAPRLRLLLPEFEFEIDIPDDVIAEINIDEVKKLLRVKESNPTTSLILSCLSYQ